MRNITIAIATLTLVLAFGCKNQNQSSYSSTDTGNTATASSNSEYSSSQQAANLSPEDLGQLGAKIKKHPKDAQKILSDKGLTEQQFEQAVRKVAENPDQSKRYADAYKKAS